MAAAEDLGVTHPGPRHPGTLGSRPTGSVGCSGLRQTPRRRPSGVRKTSQADKRPDFEVQLFQPIRVSCAGSAADTAAVAEFDERFGVDEVS